MHMSMIEILVFASIHIFGSVLTPLVVFYWRRSFQLSLAPLLIGVTLNLVFLALYLWLMNVSVWAYYIIWVLTVLGTVLQIVGIIVSLKELNNTKEVWYGK